jgi:H+-translocating NAD(P) transhydrogenase subunit alpha
MTVGVPLETYPGEKRVALVPTLAAQLKKKGLEVIVEAGAGASAGYTDAAYEEKGARLGTRAEVFSSADAILQVRTLGANPEAGRSDLELLRRGQVVIGFAEPLTQTAEVQALAEKGALAFSMELMPRITRAQSMDALSSMATVAGYEAVLLAAVHLPKMFPMMMTAAGTIAPARVFVIGAGVAGLQAIASSKRLGAIVEAYDVRPAVKEQVESLGGRFVELPIESAKAEGEGGYAKAMDEEFYRRQRELMATVIAANDVVISTAAVPGKRAPILVTREMVAGMAPGSVVVDIAAERGGNCELTQPGETVVSNGVTILGPLNLPSRAPFHASQMYAKNITTFLLHMVNKEGKLEIDPEDEIVRETLLTRDGEVVHPRVLEVIGAAKA